MGDRRAGGIALSSPSGRCPEGTEGPEREARRFSAHWRSHPLRPRLRLWLRRPHFPAYGEDIPTAQTSGILSRGPCRGRRELSLFGRGCTGSVCRPIKVIWHGRQQTRVREAFNPCSRLNSGLTGLPHASHSRSRDRGDFGAPPLIALLRQGYEGHFSPKGEG